MELCQLERDLRALVLNEQVPGSDGGVGAHPLDLWRASLSKVLSEIAECDPDTASKSIQWPNNIDNGDLTVTLPRLRPGIKPGPESIELLNQFPKDHHVFMLPFVESVHLRVLVKPTILPQLVLPPVLEKRGLYGGNKQNSVNNSQKIVLEFSSPNITSEFQGKHLRSTIIGGFISRLYELFGWDVTRINYLGDWGKPIALLYVGWKRFGSEEAFEADPVGHLLEVYHKIEEEFKPEQAASRQARDEAAKEGKDEGEAQLEIENRGIFAERNEASKRLEDGDEELVAFWKRIREATVQDYQTFYERLGVRFDEYSGESEVKSETMIEVEEMLKAKLISEESAGAWMVDMKKLGARAGHAIVRDRSGNTMYLLRDLAAVFERSRKYSFDKMIYVAAGDNSTHFTQLFKIVEALDKDLASKLHHVKFSDSSKIAATLGKGYKPQNILDKCEEAVSTILEADGDKASLIGNSEQITKGLGISALLTQELSTRFTSAHAFDLATLKSFKLGSGPDLQYWYAKIRSLLAGHEANATLSDEDRSALAEEDQANLLRILAQYPEVVNATFHSLEPSGVVTYLTGVTDQLSICLDEEEGEVEINAGVVALLEATRIVLESGLKLLGISPLADLPKERADTPVAE